MSDPVSEPAFGAFLALDWGDQQHAFALLDAASGERQRGVLSHTPEALQAWAAELIARFGPAPIAVCLEQSRGALLSMLLQFENFVLYPVPPQAAAKLRQAFYSSGSKDDPRDAELLLEILHHHRRHLRRLTPDSVEIRKLQLLVADRRDLVDEKSRQKNRLSDRLKQYYPQLLEWFDELDTPLALDFLERWPTLEAAQRARPAALRKFFDKHGCHNRQRNEQRIAGIRQALPLTSDEAVCEPARAMVLTLAGLLRQLRQGIAVVQKKIEELTAAHEDFTLFEGLPGTGAALAPRLLAAFGSRRERFGRCRPAVASPRFGSRAASTSACTCAGPVPSFCGRPFTNSRPFLSADRFGRKHFTNKNGSRARITMRPCAPWFSSGFGFCIVAGKTASLMRNRRNRATWRPSGAAAPRWFETCPFLWKACELAVHQRQKNLLYPLDRPTQMAGRLHAVHPRLGGSSG